METNWEMSNITHLVDVFQRTCGGYIGSLHTLNTKSSIKKL